MFEKQPGQSLPWGVHHGVAFIIRSIFSKLESNQPASLVADWPALDRIQQTGVRGDLRPGG